MIIPRIKGSFNLVNEELISLEININEIQYTNKSEIIIEKDNWFLKDDSIMGPLKDGVYEIKASLTTKKSKDSESANDDLNSDLNLSTDEDVIYNTYYDSTKEELTIDTTVPVITLIGNNPQLIYLNNPYIELGATVEDNLDKKPSLTIDSSLINIAKIGNYKVIYTSVDFAGNTFNITRTVNVINSITDDKNTTNITVSSLITNDNTPTIKGTYEALMHEGVPTKKELGSHERTYRRLTSNDYLEFIEMKYSPEVAYKFNDFLLNAQEKYNREIKIVLERKGYDKRDLQNNLFIKTVLLREASKLPTKAINLFVSRIAENKVSDKLYDYFLKEIRKTD